MGFRNPLFLCLAIAVCLGSNVSPLRSEDICWTQGVGSPEADRAVGQGALAVVDVGDDAEVSGQALVHRCSSSLGQYPSRTV